MKNMKLWSKGESVDSVIEQFTVGKDKELDVYLAECDVLGSIAHAEMLHRVQLISTEEVHKIHRGLFAILEQISRNEFQIDDGVEDVHSQVELILGKEGEKLHTARSRNDQVLLDLKIYYRIVLKEWYIYVSQIAELFLQMAEEYKDIKMPGYTHTQVAMTSSFGMWFGAFAEGFIELLETLRHAFQKINKSPLGSAAGYGSSFPIDRAMTSDMLGFSRIHINPINAQFNRNKSDLVIAQSIAMISLEINKLCSDLILYSNENYRFLSLPTEFTTGSSIMPHKKNPDVFEIMRGKSNISMLVQSQVVTLCTNLTTGYHRDFQLLKELIFPTIKEVNNMFEMLLHSIPKVKVNKDILCDERYTYLTTVDAINQRVMRGQSFRSAYRDVGEEVKLQTFKSPEKIEHTHLGSLGNLGLEEMKARLQEAREYQEFENVEKAMKELRRMK